MRQVQVPRERLAAAVATFAELGGPKLDETVDLLIALVLQIESSIAWGVVLS
jgi:hypothetical protein